VHLAGVDPSVQAFFARALARDRSQRFASAHEMARALAATAAARMPAPLAPPAPPARPLLPIAPAPRRDLAVRPIPLHLRPGGPGRPPERRWLALSIAAVAVVSIVVGVIAVATSGQGGSAAAAVAPDRRSERDAPAIEPAAPHATIERAINGSLHAPAAVAPARREPAASGTPAELCEAACSSGCGLEGPDCVRVCLADPRSVDCLETTGTRDCAAWSRCVLGASCSEPPRGDATCGETYACERSCRDNVACGCSCLGRMAPAHELALTRLSTCALFVCANDPTCVRDRCRSPLAACDAG